MKKVRMDQREADRLARLALQLNVPEADVLREGLALMERLQEGKLQIPDDRVRLGADLKRLLDDFEHLEQ